jgi:hypothetical protein
MMETPNTRPEAAPPPVQFPLETYEELKARLKRDHPDLTDAELEAFGL